MNRVPSLLVCMSLAAASLGAAERRQPPNPGPRHFDARVEFNKGYTPPTPQRRKELSSLAVAARVPVSELAVTRDEATGAVRSLSSHVGYLSDEAGIGSALADDQGASALPLALDFVSQNRGLLGLEDSDLAEYEVARSVYSQPTGATHLYLRQMVDGLPVYNGELHVNVNRDGRILSVNNLFMPRAAQSRNAQAPTLDLAQAVVRAARHAGLRLPGGLQVMDAPQGVQQVSRVDHVGFSREPVEGKLMWLPIRAGMMRLVWNFQIATLDGQHWWDLTVDAHSGRIWTRFDWVASDSYRVYASPAESPNHTTPVPPADGRTLLSNPTNSTASPFGWHDTNGAAGAEFTTTQGNNAHAYTDTDANNSPDAGSSPSGGAGLNFDFPLDLTQAPSAYRPGAVTNLFYWNNIIHDVQYQYGFDEAAGNFQQNNYGRGGAGADYVQAEAQDGSGTNNANFATPPDGQRPRMQMYVWTAPTPDKDGDLDASIVIHEYGHGISNRLVGTSVNCLTNNQQPGEGLSDWWALAYTAKPGDTGPQGRGIGTYALNQPTTGLGIRTQRYSTDPGVNTWTYASMNGMAIPHGVGSVWAQAAWEVYWALVNQWGFDANLYNATGSAGNQRAMLYVNEGLKNTACNPTFTQVRDGIIQAATDNHGGADVCRIWTAFAGFGLGTNAVSGGANSTSPTNGFNVPSSCGGTNVPPVANAGPDQSVAVGALVTLNGGGSSDPDGGPSPLSYAWSQVSGPAVTLSGATTANPTFTAGTAGTYVFSLQVSDGAATATDQVTVSAGVGIAAYDSVLRAPKCGSVGNLCDSGTLVNGRANLGPEPNQPNTINNSCADGTSGSFHSDESNDRLRAVSVDGTNFAAGKQVRIEATVWAYSSFTTDKLDLYYAANANSPSWTFLTTITPTAAGAQTLSATYTLPTGTLQAVRANFRYQGAVSSCSTGAYDDRDDLIFAVGAGAPDTTPPTTSITSPTAGSTVSGTTTISANASDNVGVTNVEFYLDGVLLGSDSSSPYSFAWNTTTASNGSHTLTTKAYDAATNVGTSPGVSVTVSNGGGPVTVFYDGAESASTTFVLTNVNAGTQWTRQNSGAHTGAWRWKAGSATGGNYANNGDARLTTPTLNLAGASTATLNYRFQYKTEANYDFFEVRISTNGGSTYTNLVRVSGQSSGYPAWAPQGTLNLNSYVGQTNVKVQFRFTTDFSITDFGVALDEVSIVKQ